MRERERLTIMGKLWDNRSIRQGAPRRAPKFAASRGLSQAELAFLRLPARLPRARAQCERAQCCELSLARVAFYSNRCRGGTRVCTVVVLLPCPSPPRPPPRRAKPTNVAQERVHGRVHAKQGPPVFARARVGKGRGVTGRGRGGEVRAGLFPLAVLLRLMAN